MAVLLGSLTVDGSGTFFNSGDVGGSRWQAVASGSLATISAPILASGFTSLGFAIYADSAGSPAARLGTTVTTSSTAAGTKALAMVAPVAVTSGTFYWLALMPTGGSVDLTQQATGSLSYKTAAGSFTDPWGTSTDTGVGGNLPMLGEDSGAGASGVFIPRRMSLSG
jgi:hypothetical protein